MSKSDWLWAPRRRLGAATMTAVMTGLLLPGSGALAAVPPNLTGEFLASYAAALITSGTCNPASDSTFTFSISGTATGPYPGTFLETGTVTIGAQIYPIPGTTNQYRGPVTAFAATFTITSAAGTVSGTKSFAHDTGPYAYEWGVCATGGGNTVGQILVSTGVAYDAAVTAPSGFLADHGTSWANFNIDSWELSPFTAYQFREGFASTPGPANTPPTAGAGGPYSGTEGSAVVVGGTAADPDGDIITTGWSYTVVASAPETTCAFADVVALTTTVTCTDNGTFTLTLTANDGVSPPTTSTATLTVSNVSPTVATLEVGGGHGTACIAGNATTLTFGFTDPGINDNPWAVDIDWGDGSAHTEYNTNSQGVQAVQAHAYGDGTFTISLKVTDTDGGVGTTSGVGAVSHLYAMTGILAPFNADGTSVWKHGSTIPVKVIITDCTGAGVSGLAPTVGTTLQSSSDPTTSVDETASTNAADTTGIMRDAGSGQYVYNFGSRYLTDPTATYYMTVKGTNSNGTIVTVAGIVQVKFGLKTK